MIDKEQVVDMLRARGEHDKALRVKCALPRQVDPEDDAGLLHAFGINTSDLPHEDSATAIRRTA